MLHWKKWPAAPFRRAASIVAGKGVAFAACMTLALAMAFGATRAGAQASPLIVQNAWLRKAPGVDTAAVYLVLKNPGVQPVVVVGVRSAAASQVMIHESSTTGGQSQMRAYDRLIIAPGKSVAFQPGGLHVMLSGLKGNVTVGQTVPLVLVLSNGTTVPVAAVVRPLDAQ
jgi:periplasmic copper chaperone A